MIKIFLKSKILLSIWIVSMIILSSLFFFVPYITEKNIDDILIQNSKNTVTQIKLTRSYYLDSIVNKIADGNHNLIFTANYKNKNNALPVPATIIYDLSEIFSKNMGVKFRTYSNFPFKNRAGRILSPTQKKILKDIGQSGGIYVSKDFVEDKPVLRVAIADYMTESSCVKCHNNHPNRTWSRTKWKLGDIRGVIEVITPLEKPLAKITIMRNSILLFVFVIFVILIIFYSYMLVRREDELLKINDILDKRVKEEIEKNNEKEQILIQKSKLSAMGEMINNIAHQWRQPIAELSSLLINIDTRFSMKKIDENFMNSKIKKGENILNYLSYTIDDFQNFFKLDKEKSVFKIDEVISDVLNISSISSTKNINIIKKINPNIKLYGFKTELSQVVLNIIANAKEAMSRHSTKDGFIKIYTIESKKNVSIIVEDNAGGIKKEDLAKIFELYFSKKENGSGIGLYMSKIIIEKHFDGVLKAKNIGNGVKFTITLPLYKTI